MKGVKVVEKRRHEDARGWLHKGVTASDLAPGTPFGEVYVVAALPGQSRGNHLHRLMGEWFTVVVGEGEVVVVDPASGEREEIPMGESRPRAIYVPKGIAHALVNRSESLMICVAWAEGQHDHSDVEPFLVEGNRQG